MFCMCTAVEIVRSDQTDETVYVLPNGERPEGVRHVGWVLPERPMQAKIGVQQYLTDTPNIGGRVEGTNRQHYPNVDVFRCNDCGARFAR